MSREILSNFENESAEDFLADISTNGYGYIAIALEKITDSDEDPGLITCEEALIACEIIAAVCGRPSHDFPRDLSEWIEIFLPEGSIERIEVQQLAETGADVIDQLVANSELRDYWEGSSTYDSWFNTQVDLQERLLG